MKIHLYVLLFTVVFIHHSKCGNDEPGKVTETISIGSESSQKKDEVSSDFRERLHQFKTSILKNGNISAQDLTELFELIDSADIIQWKLEEFNLKVKFSDDEIKKHASLFLYAVREIIKEKGSTVVPTTPTNGPTPSTNSETSEQQSTPSKSPTTTQKVPKTDASSSTQVSEVLCDSVKECKSLANHALWGEALEKYIDANPGKLVVEDDFIKYFKSVMEESMNVSDFESISKVTAEPPTVVTDTPPNDTTDNEQTQKNGNDQNDRKTENGSDQNDKMKGFEDVGNSNGQVTVETSGNAFSGLGAWHFITIFIVISAAVVIGYVCMHNRKKLREGVGMYLADANRNRKRARDYRPLKMKA